MRPDNAVSTRISRTEASKSVRGFSGRVLPERPTVCTHVCCAFEFFTGEGDYRHLEAAGSQHLRLRIREAKELVIRTRLDRYHAAKYTLRVRDAADIVARCTLLSIAGEPVWPANHFGPPHVKTVGDVIRDVETVTGRRLDVKALNLPGEVSRLSLRDENFLNYKYTDLAACSSAAHGSVSMRSPQDDALGFTTLLARAWGRRAPRRFASPTTP